MTAPDIRALVRSCDPDLTGLRDRALLLLGYAGLPPGKAAATRLSAVKVSCLCLMATNSPRRSANGSRAAAAHIGQSVRPKGGQQPLDLRRGERRIPSRRAAILAMDAAERVIAAGSTDVSGLRGYATHQLGRRVGALRASGTLNLIHNISNWT
jgi:hypothetical protein